MSDPDRPSFSPFDIARLLAAESLSIVPRIVDRTCKQVLFAAKAVSRVTNAGVPDLVSDPDNVIPMERPTEDVPPTHRSRPPQESALTKTSDTATKKAAKKAPQKVSSSANKPAKKAAAKKKKPAKKAAAKKKPAKKAAEPKAVESLAIVDYDVLAASQIIARLDGLSESQRTEIKHYEMSHRGRRTVLGRLAQLEQ